MRLEVAARSDVGRVRPGNEDAFLVEDGDADAGDVRLIAVADGMGGHQAGEVASATAIAALVDGIRAGAAMGDAITAANTSVFAKAADDPELRGMGTTLTAALLDGHALAIGHVGDSRAYLLRGGALSQVTTDHSVIAELIAAGELTAAEAELDPRRAMITRALGIDPDVQVDVLTLELEPGDRLLLCSDGLTTMVRDDAIAGVLQGEPDRITAAEQLIRAANDAGGADNITVVIADAIDDTAPEPTDVIADAPTLETTTDADEPTQPTAVVDEAPPKRRWWQRRSAT